MRDRHLWWIVGIDRICWHGCIRCGTRAALFIVQERFVTLCPKCVAERIEGLRQRGKEIPDWLEQLDREVRHELRAQERRAREALTVSWTDLVRCAKCGRVIRLKDARYPPTEGESVCYPHCQGCYGIVRGKAAAAG